ncbi:MAG: flippase-like domain-containing protein [Clostridiales bacterium]|nr:flippase-like domain-containing protein [Clostridiales bacterium]
MKKIWINSLIVVAMGAVIVILIFFTDGIDQLIKLIKNINYAWLFVAFSFMFLYWGAGAFTIGFLKKGVLEKCHKPRHNFKTLMIGQFFAAITPFSTGGQPAQIYFMSKQKIDTGKATSIIIMKSVLYATSMLVIAFVFFFIKKKVLVAQIPNFVLLFVIGTLANSLLIVMYFLFLLNHDISEKVIILFLKVISYFKNKDKIYVQRQFDKIRGSLISFQDGFRIITKRKGYLILAYLSQLLQHLAIYSVPIFLIRAVEGSFPNPFSVIAATGLLMMITALVPTPGTTGGAEGLGVYFFASFYVTAPILSVILIWRMITYYSSILFGGIFCLINHGKAFGDFDS